MFFFRIKGSKPLIFEPFWMTMTFVLIWKGIEHNQKAVALLASDATIAL